MKLKFELIESDDGLIAKRARVKYGWIYLFQSIPGETIHSEATPMVTSCYVPDLDEDLE